MSHRMLHFQNETNASCPDLRGQGYRASFHTHSAARGPRKKIYHGHLEGSGPRKGEHAVVKVFRDVPGTAAMCDAEIDKHRLGLKMARRFNKLVSDPRAKISFTLPLKSTVESLAVGQYLTRHRHGRHLDKMEWVLIEENLVRQGEYQVFIDKTGDTLDKSPTALDAFLHFTYHESGRKFLLCGFQGVQTEKGYLLTTPCIHSEGSSFGTATDGGPTMMGKIFVQHVCNNLCYIYDRPSHTEETVRSEEKDSTVSVKEEDTDNGFNVTQGSGTQPDICPSSRMSTHDDFLTDRTTELAIVVNSSDNSDESYSSANRISMNGRCLEDTTKNLAYCCTDLSSSIIEEVEEKQKHAEKKEEESEKKTDHDFLKRIHLGDQIREKNSARSHPGFIFRGPTHRSNVQAIGGIQKRPSI